MKTSKQRNGIPNRVAKQKDRSRRDGNSDKRIQSHCSWKAQGLACHLSLLRFCIASKVRDIQGNGGPESDNRRERRNKNKNEFASRLEFARCAQHRAEAAGLMRNPPQQ